MVTVLLTWFSALLRTSGSSRPLSGSASSISVEGMRQLVPSLMTHLPFNRRPQQLSSPPLVRVSNLSVLAA